MYQNKHGRFTAPDPLLASASPLNPQTFNRYTYTGSNPINLTDPSGLCVINGQEDKQPCGNVRGRQIYANKNRTEFSTAREKGFTPYDGPDITKSFYGVSYRITRNGWTQLGPREGVSVNGPATNGIVDPGSPSPSGQIAPRGALPLPCPAGNCGSEPLHTR